MRECLQREGAQTAGGTPEDFAAHFKAEMTKWGKSCAKRASGWNKAQERNK